MLKSVMRVAASPLRGAVAAAILMTSPAAKAVEGDSGRYTMSPVEGGIARLDRDTGAVSICTGKEGQWACSPAVEKQQELERRIKELESENRQLRGEKPSPAPSPESGTLPHGDATPPAPPGDLPMPTEKDVDKLFDYVEGMVKKFKERIERLEKEAQKNQMEERPL